MRILVIDDSVSNQAAAKAQLSGHEVTVVGSYDEGRDLLATEDEDGIPREGKHDFEVVLVDLLMPASRHRQGNEGSRFVGQEMPVGIFLALLAAKTGAKYVAVLTDSDHHSHPASACLDVFNSREDTPSPLTVGGAKVLLSNNRQWVGYFSEDNFLDEVPMDQAGTWEGTDGNCPPRVKSGYARAKKWRVLLDYLVA